MSAPKVAYCRGCRRVLVLFPSSALSLRAGAKVIRAQGNGGPFLRRLVGGRVPHGANVCLEAHRPTPYAIDHAPYVGPPKVVKAEVVARRVGVPKALLAERLRKAAFRATRRALGVLP